MKFYSDKHLSIVVRGNLDNRFSKNCLVSLRNQFPNAEIIVSTWHGECTDFIYGYDKLILTKDPGHTPSNGVRQFLSGIKGLERATRPLAMVVRADLKFINNRILTFFDHYDKTRPRYPIFEKQICVSDIYTHKPADRFGFVCDFAFTGLTGDLRKLFSIDPYWYLSNPHGYAIEQIFGLGNYHLTYGEYIDREIAEDILVNQFKVLRGQSAYGFVCQKYPQWLQGWNENCMNGEDWVRLYKEKYGIKTNTQYLPCD